MQGFYLDFSFGGGTFLPSSFPILSFFPLLQILSERWVSIFILSHVHWSDPLPCMRHCFRHKGDTNVTQSWCPASGAQCSWRTMGTSSCVVWVGPPWFWRSTAWPHLPAHHSPNWRATGSALWWIWKFEALVQEVFQSTICFVCPLLSWNLLSQLVLISSGFGPRLLPWEFCKSWDDCPAGRMETDVACSVWPVGAWAVGYRQP